MRPDHIRDGANVVYDWLAENGIDEWIPEQPNITTSRTELSYTAFVWDGPRGWDPEHLVVNAGGAVHERRTVPLLVPMPPDVRDLLCSRGPRRGRDRTNS